MPLRELVGILLEQLEIAEKEIAELEKSNEHYVRRFNEVSNELEMSNDITNVKEKLLEEIKDLAYEKIKRDYNMLNEQMKEVDKE